MQRWTRRADRTVTILDRARPSTSFKLIGMMIHVDWIVSRLDGNYLNLYDDSRVRNLLWLLIDP
jgi:hypothetical protein